MVTAALLVPVSACGPAGASRTDVVRRYREELVTSGVSQDQARCVTDRFFAGLTDAQLRQFQDREALTDDERQRFRTLGEECARGATGG